jgi:hypothetical protein
MKRAIKRYKYFEQKGWGSIFGRLVAGHLDLNPETFAEFELIVPSPAYVGPALSRPREKNPPRQQTRRASVFGRAQRRVSRRFVPRSVPPQNGPRREE